MRINAALAALAITPLFLSACATTQQHADVGFRPPEGNYRVIVLQPDISVSVLTAGGMLEPHEAWTNQARENVLNVLVARQAARGAHVHVAASREQVGADPALVADLINLHNAVGNSIKLHKYSGLMLPTKKDRFDWTLGSAAVAFGAASQYDYALFLHAQDSFSSGGRVALQIAGFLTCMVGVCVAPAGGQQVAFVSLVDLKTGKVVWFNALTAFVGDIRSPEGAEKMVTALLEKMNPGTEARVSGQT